MKRLMHHRDGEIAGLKLVERRLVAIVKWLEVNQPDVFNRGLWDAINEVERGDAFPTSAVVVGLWTNFGEYNELDGMAPNAELTEAAPHERKRSHEL